MRSRCLTIILIVCIIANMPVGKIHAQEFQSVNFKVLDPVLSSANYATSTDFQLWGSIAQLGIGTSPAADFKVNAGSLFFPSVSTPAVAATAGDSQVSLSWTAAVGVLGWTVSGYNIGQAIVSGGPYTFSASLGNVLSSTRTGLSNGTSYYFVVRAEDAFGNPIATSSEVSVAPVASTPTPAPSPVPASGGGGGGGGGYTAPPATGVNISGRAYPLSKVTILKDGQIAVTTIAGPDAKFEANLTGLSAGNYLFVVYGQDAQERRSSLFTFPVVLTQGALTAISGIFLAPTIAVDKSEVKRGEDIAIFGQSAPQTDITIAVNSDEEFFVKTKADKAGVYLYNLDTAPLEIGQHLTKSKAALHGEVSVFGKAVGFAVGSKTVLAAPEKKCQAKADLNGDCRVNLIDFSIAAYWYKRPLSAEFKSREATRLNGDGRIDLVDFSIMAFYWTG